MHIDKQTSLADKQVTEVVNKKWGEIPADNFGYGSDEERRNKRGLEDWELVEKIPESQKGVPKWFIAVIAAVLLVAIGLSFPFWGDRPGYERNWIDWGFGAALLYLFVFGAFVYFMVNKYSPSVDGIKEDVDPAKVSNQTQKKICLTSDTARIVMSVSQEKTKNAYGVVLAVRRLNQRLNWLTKSPPNSLLYFKTRLTFTSWHTWAFCSRQSMIEKRF